MKNIKYLRINLKIYTKDLCTKKYKILLWGIKDDKQVYCFHVLKDNII